MMTLNYLTNNFIRTDCGIHGAQLSDRDCKIIRRYVQRLDKKGKFHHTGVYWIANELAANGVIHPQLQNKTEFFRTNQQI